MSYFDLKTWHVVVACCLTSAFFYALLPLKPLLLSSQPLPNLKQRTTSFFKRQIQWVLPTGILQVILGMAALFSEPVRAPVGVSMLLMTGAILLAFTWLAGLGLVKNESNQARLKRFFLTWLLALSLIMLVILYVMVNMRSMY